MIDPNSNMMTVTPPFTGAPGITVEMIGNSLVRFERGGGGGTSSTLLNTCVNNKQEKSGLFSAKNMYIAQGACLGSEMPFVRKKWVFFFFLFKIYLNSSDSNLCKGSNLRTNSCLGDDFCIMAKTCLGAYFKSIVHACVHLYI